MGVPKRKTSKGRRDRRRGRKKITIPSTIKCKNCGAEKLPHTQCPECGK